MTAADEPLSPSGSPAEKSYREYLDRLARGEELDFEAFCAERPAEASELRGIHRQREEFLRHGAEAARMIRDEVSGDSGEDPESGSGGSGSSHDSEAEEGLPPSFKDLLRKLRRHPETASRYHLRGEVAHGGMGAILRIHDDELDRDLAMKVILGQSPAATGVTPPVDSSVLARFLDEAQITGRLDHPGIVPVHELGIDSQGRVYFAMRLVKGHDLKEVFRLIREGSENWNEARALGVLLKACEAVAYAHNRKVIHRDLKPANIMVGRFGEVYVMDWGLARELGRGDLKDLRLRPEGSSDFTTLRSIRREEADSTPDSPLVTMDGHVVGTPSYMPPEQASGELDRLGPRSDVYAMGAMLYELITGAAPYVVPGVKKTQHTILAEVLNGPPRSLREMSLDVAPPLLAICEKAMRREPSERYGSMVELSEDLQAFLEGRVVAAYRATALERAARWVRGHRVVVAVLFAVISAIVAAMFAVWYQWANEQRDRRVTLEAGLDLVESREHEAARAKLSDLLTEENERTEEGRTALLAEIGLLYRCGWPAEGRKLLDEARRSISALPEARLRHTLPGHAAFARVLEDGLPPPQDDWIGDLCRQADPDIYERARSIAEHMKRNVVFTGLPSPMVNQGRGIDVLPLEGGRCIVYAANEATETPTRPVLQVLDLRNEENWRIEFPEDPWLGRTVKWIQLLGNENRPAPRRMIVLSKDEKGVHRLTDCELDIAGRAIRCGEEYELRDTGTPGSIFCWQPSSAIDDVVVIVYGLNELSYHHLIGKEWSSPPSNLPGLFNTNTPGFLLRGDFTGDGEPELLLSLMEWGEYSLHLVRELPGTDDFVHLSSQRFGTSAIGCSFEREDSPGRLDLFFAKYMTSDELKQSFEFFGRFRPNGIDDAARIARFDESTREFRTLAAEPTGLRMKGLFATPVDLAVADLDGDGEREYIQLVATSPPGMGSILRPEKCEFTVQILHRPAREESTDFEPVLVASCNARHVLATNLDEDREAELVLVSWPNEKEVEVTIHGYDAK